MNRRKQVSGRSVAGGIAMLVFAAAVFVAPVSIETAVAQESQTEERKTRKTPAMREKIYKQLSEAQVAAEAENSHTPTN